MAELHEIRTLLQQTTAALSELQADIAQFPNEPGLLVNANSLQKRQRELEEDFLAAARTQGEAVCSYRLFTDTRPTISALSKALLDFQSVFSLIYSAIRRGPRARAVLGAELTRETSFNFGYTFAGSVGVVFTLPAQERSDEEQNLLDRTIETVFGLAKAQNPEQVAEFARELGRPPIKATYTWAKDHAFYGLGASVKWYRGPAASGELSVQRPELERLRDIIALSTEETTEEITVYGLLEAADIRRRTFRILADDGTDIRGHFDQAISEAHTVVLPRRYVAVLRKRSRVILATDQEDITYHLLRLDLPGLFSR
jgi:hypothetical protein